MMGWCPHDGEECHHDGYCEDCPVEMAAKNGQEQEGGQ